MAAYHVVLVHFPIALWMTATLAILLRAFSDGELARAVDRALVPLLTVALISGLAAFAVGLMVWPWETISSTPLGRNHVLLASWTVAHWALLLGSVLLGITGTLGGHLVGIYTEVSNALRWHGWEVFTTFYVPHAALAAIGVITLLLIGLGLWGRRASASPGA
jgi:hypothetical protein